VSKKRDGEFIISECSITYIVTGSRKLVTRIYIIYGYILLWQTAMAAGNK